MKTIKILKLTGVVLLGLVLTSQVEVVGRTAAIKEKKTIVLPIEKPINELMAKISARFDSEDFSALDRNIEAWMFDAGYLNPAIETGSEVPVPWLNNIHFDNTAANGVGDDAEMEAVAESGMEVSVPWMENIHFSTVKEEVTEDVTEVPVPWMDNLHFD